MRRTNETRTQIDTLQNTNVFASRNIRQSAEGPAEHHQETRTEVGELNWTQNVPTH
jgi:hypothetical protein